MKEPFMGISTYFLLFKTVTIFVSALLVHQTSHRGFLSCCHSTLFEHSAYSANIKFCCLNRKARRNLSSCRPYHHKTNGLADYFILWLLTCGDVHPNPGPGVPYPCGRCGRNASSGSIGCSLCGTWFHRACSGLNKNEFKVKLFESKSGNFSWKCETCKITSGDIRPPPSPAPSFPLPDFSDSFIERLNDTSMDDSSVNCSLEFGATLPRQLEGAGVNMGHLNINKLRGKVDEVKLLLVDYRLDVLFLSETKLDAKVSNKMLYVDGYRIFRRDRDFKGGGLLCYCRVGLKAVNETSLQTPNSENIVICINIEGRRFSLLGFYRPPNKNVAEFLSDFGECIAGCYRKARGVFCCGDMNIDWLCEGNSKSSLSDLLSNWALVFRQQEPTRPISKSLIDHIYISHPDQFGEIVTIPVGASDHSLIAAKLLAVDFSNRKARVSFRKWRGCDFELINSALREIDWSLCYSLQTGEPDLDCDSVLAKWNGRLFGVVDRHCPVISKVVYTQKPPWMAANIERFIRKRDKIAKTVYRAADKESFRSLRNRITSLKRTAKNCYYGDLASDNICSRKFHQVIQSASGLGRENSQCSEITIVHNGSLIANQPTVANVLNDYFINVAAAVPCDNSDSSHSLVEIRNRHSNSHPLVFAFTTAREVQSILKSMSGRKAPGHDSLPSGLLKQLPALIVPITDLINYFIWLDFFPTAWKQAIVKPLFKNGSEVEPKNYRPVSLLPVLSKIYEKVLYLQLFTWFQPKFNDDLTGFMPGQSCETALLRLLEQCRLSMDKRQITAITSLDFSKAFDSVNHKLLLTKLSSYGCDPSSIRLIDSYLSDRSQIVQVGSHKSSAKTVLAGVPQGSILGPLLFNIFVNDLSWSVTDCSLIRFADETNIYKAAASSRDLERALNNDLASVVQWSAQNGLLLNPSKTQGVMLGSQCPSLNVCVDGSPVKMSDSIKILGFTIDSQLNAKSHVSNVVKLVGLKSHQLRYISKFVPSKVAISLFKSYVLPHLNYCSSLFITFPDTQINRLLVCERKAIRVTLGLNRRTTTSEIQKENGIDNCLHRAVLRATIIARNIISGRMLQQLAEHFVPRNRGHYNFRGDRLVHAAYNLRVGKNAFVAIMTKIWNSLPVGTTDLRSLRTFTRIINSLPLEEIFWDVRRA